MKRARLKEYKNGTWTTETRECDVRKESEQIEKNKKRQ
jgi:hypothetical protein